MGEGSGLHERTVGVCGGLGGEGGKGSKRVHLCVLHTGKNFSHFHPLSRQFPGCYGCAICIAMTT